MQLSRSRTLEQNLRDCTNRTEGIAEITAMFTAFAMSTTSYAGAFAIFETTIAIFDTTIAIFETTIAIFDTTIAISQSAVTDIYSKLRR